MGIVMSINDEEQLKEMCLKMTGHTDDIQEAFEQWENERGALSEFADENAALRIIFRRFIVALDIAKAVMTNLENESGLFLSPKTQAKIDAFGELYKKLEKDKFQGRVIAGQIKTI